MKKIIVILAALLAVSLLLVSCTEKPEATPNENETEVNTPVETKTAVETLSAAYDQFAQNLVDSYGMPAEDIKLGFIGGYYDENDETTLVQGGVGKLPVENAMVTTTGLIPEANLSMIDDVAFVQHPMMVNFFACTAFRVTDAANVDAVAAALDESVKNNNWMCGQPEGYAIVTVDNTVISVYGLNDNVTAMKNALTTTYENAVVAHEGSFSAEEFFAE